MAKHKQAQEPKRPTWQPHKERMQPKRNATSTIRGKLISTNQTQARESMGPHAAAKLTYQK